MHGNEDQQGGQLREVLTDIRAALHVLILLQLSQRGGQLPETLRDRMEQLIAQEHAR